MTKLNEKGIYKAAVIVKDDYGMLNHMTMYYMEPGTYEEKDVPDMFKVNGKNVAAILISQYTNAIIKHIPVSLPYQKPAERYDYNSAARACRRKGSGWHLMTNAEYVFLLEEAYSLGHRIGGNTDYGRNANEPREKGVKFDEYNTLTGCDPLTWSNDRTADGVFGLCGNYWEWVSGLRQNNGVIEYIKDNDAAAVDYNEDAPEWIAAKVDGKKLRIYTDGNEIGLTTENKRTYEWISRSISSLKLDNIGEMPEIAYKLGIVSKDWKDEHALIEINEEYGINMVFRGSNYLSSRYGSAATLKMSHPATYQSSGLSFRSALYLEEWENVMELLKYRL